MNSLAPSTERHPITALEEWFNESGRNMPNDCLLELPRQIMAEAAIPDSREAIVAQLPAVERPSHTISALSSSRVHAF